MPLFEVTVTVTRKFTRIVEADNDHAAQYDIGNGSHEPALHELNLIARTPILLQHWTNSAVTQKETTVKKITAQPAPSVTEPAKIYRNLIGPTRHTKRLPPTAIMIRLPHDWGIYDMTVICRAAEERERYGQPDDLLSDFIMTTAHNAAIAMLIDHRVFVADDGVYERLSKLPSVLNDALPLTLWAPRDYAAEMREDHDTIQSIQSGIDALYGQIDFYKKKIEQKTVEAGATASAIKEMALEDLQKAIQRRQVIVKPQTLTP